MADIPVESFCKCFMRMANQGMFRPLTGPKCGVKMTWHLRMRHQGYILVHQRRVASVGSRWRGTIPRLRMIKDGDYNFPLERSVPHHTRNMLIVYRCAYITCLLLHKFATSIKFEPITINRTSSSLYVVFPQTFDPSARCAHE